MTLLVSSDQYSSIDVDQMDDIKKNFSRGGIFFNSGKLDKAISIFLKCFATASILQFQSMVIDSSLKLSEIYLQQKEFFSARSFFRKAYDASQGLSVYSQALSLEQNEYAISSCKALGTHIIGECVAVGFHHKDKKMIGLAHIDVRTSFESVRHFIDLIPKGNVVVHLIGGSAHEDLIESSKVNIEKIKKALLPTSIEVVEHTLDIAHPSAFVIDLEGNIHSDTHTLFDSASRNVRSALASLSVSERPLRCAYVQKDQLMEECLVDVSPEVIDQLKPYQDMQEKQLMDLYAKAPSPKMILVDEILSLRNFLQQKASKI
jgi:hypothetical protein